MRIMWLDRLDEMLTVVKDSKSAIWGSDEIQKLFGVKTGTARKIILAATRINGPGKRAKVVTTDKLKSLLEQFATHVSTCRNDNVPPIDAGKSAGLLFETRMAEAEEAEKRDADIALPNLVNVKIDRQLVAAVRLAQQKTGGPLRQWIERAIEPQLALLATGPILVTHSAEISGNPPSVTGSALGNVRSIDSDDEQPHLPLGAREEMDIEPSSDLPKRQTKTKKAPNSQPAMQSSFFESTAS